jgi:hypothetical protein
VPKGRQAASRAHRELRFVAAPPAELSPGDVALDLRSDLGALQRSQGLAWCSAFIDWLGALNRRNASLLWWAYTSTAKNLLSSPLGDDCFGALALDRFLAGTDARRIFVTSATSAQRAALRARLENSEWRVAGGAGRTPFLPPLLRSLWQFARIFGLWCARRLRPPAGDAPQAMLFTYVDSGFRDAPDAFFGSLAQNLPVRACHVAFVQSGYLETLPKLAAAKAGCYEPLFGSLRLSDLLWGLGASLAAWWRAGRYEAPALEGVPATALLRAALRWDLGPGGYFYNVVVYRAARRLLARWRPAWLIYPYENKALEKMLLLAAREACKECRIVGYQHTSITRRHATLLFAEREAAVTPLPERIVTVGEVTRRYLERHGRYPAGIFVTGCALRQQRGPLLERRAAAGRLRLLLALSSSRRELTEAVAACRRALDADAGLEFGIRTHPEFPVALLPGELRDWVERHARNFSGSALASNLEWCDAVVYVSSTVALEALGRGRPVINLAISDALDPDPVLDPVEFHWAANTPEALVAAAREIAALDAAEFERRRRQALDYVDEYLSPPTPQALEAFLPA